MIGRQKEQKRLMEAFNSDSSEFVVVYGRRRVGKTFLVNETFGNKIAFQHTGVAKAKMKQQLVYFRDSLEDAGYEDCPVLKAKLGVAGVRTEVACWRHRADEVWTKGAQIDMLLDRADEVVNVCEMKFCKGKYTIDRDEYEAIENRRAAFEKLGADGKSVHVTMVTTEGVSPNKYADCVQSEITLNDLFND